MHKRKSDRDGIYERQNSASYWASYIDASGKRARHSTGIPKSRAGRKEAQALLAKWKLEAFKTKEWGEEPEHLFDDLMLRFIEETLHQRKRGLKPVKVTMRPLYLAFSGRDITEMTQPDVRGYIRKRYTQGVGASTINKEISMLSSAINHARKDWGWDISNPTAGCRQKVPEGRVRWITHDEANLLLEAARENKRALHLEDFIRLALNTGCRKGELLGLEWARVDLTRRVINLEAKHTKTGKRRAIPINDDAFKSLIGRARFRSEYCPDSPWVFCDKNGRRIQNVKKSFNSACEKVGIKDFRIHDLRHTCAAWLVTAGVDLIVVRDLLGHSTKI